MSTNSHSLAGPGGATATLGAFLSGPARTLAAHAKRLWVAYWDYQAQRATVAMLESLDDRLLQDIGFRRSEIPSVVFGKDAGGRRPYDPHWQRPS